jgi:apolipoprotein N-acyltransferase
VLQLASVGGVPLLSGLVVLISTAAAMLALSRARRHRVGAAVCAGLVVVASVWGAARMARNDLAAAGQPIRVGLVQGNVPQDQKWDPAYRAEITRRYVDLSRDALGQGAQLVIWPEASTPFYFDVDGVMAEPIRRLARDTRTPFVVGTDEFEAGREGGADRFFNAAALVGPDGRTRASYRKIRLVPFGEYVPFKRLLFFVGPLIEAVSDFSPGAELTVFDVEGTRFSVAICYEIIYADLARDSVTKGSQLLTTMTNDAWFGRSSAAYQHFEMAAVRAVEQGRYLVRAANTGISGAVDPYGRVLASTPLFETRVLMTDVRLLSGRTAYAVIGDAPLYLSLAVTLLWLVRGRRA